MALEFDFDYYSGESALYVNFFGPRNLIRLNIRFCTRTPMEVVGCAQIVDQEWTPLDSGVTYSRKQGDHVVKMSFVDAIQVKRLKLNFKQHVDAAQYSVEAKISRDGYPDFASLMNALELYKQNRKQETISSLLEYSKIVTGNHKVQIVLARLFKDLGQLDHSELYAMKATVNGAGDKGLDFFRSVRAENMFRDLPEIRKLQHDADDWQPGDHHGAVVLSQEYRYRFGLDGWYIKEFRAMLEIKRELAARFIRRLDIGFTSRDVLIDSHMRIVHGDDSIEELSPECFSLGDSHARNVFIVGTTDKIGTWVLPDLAVGDVIEWSYRAGFRENPAADGAPAAFVASALCDNNFPTFQSRVEFENSEESDLACACLNGAPPFRVRDTDSIGRTAYEILAERLIPIWGTGCSHETYLFNPVVACTTKRSDWVAVAGEIRRDHVGAFEENGALPSPLEDMLKDSKDARECMERVFYWVRDKIKYGSFLSAEERIGNEGRLHAIVNSGFGDCKDRSYILASVARRLNLENRFVVASAKRGITLQELPADQFDHIFVKVLIDNEWFYMDAADSGGVFGLPTSSLQGLQAFELNDTGGEVITLPLDSPHRNSIELVEVFDRLDENRLSGRFTLSASGRVARSLDQQWKVLSLQISNQIQGEAHALDDFMPAIELTRADRLSHTGYSDTLAIQGNHARGEAHQFEDSLITTLGWRHPSLAVNVWTLLNDEGPFVFPIPLRFDITCLIEGPLYEQLLECSRAPVLSNDLCDVSADVTRDQSSIRIHRSIVIKTRFVSPKQACQVPEIKQAVSQALRLVLRFRRI